MQLALLAGVARSALSISGIGTAHWATRALLMGSMLLAISSILTSALGPGIFYIFFGEDMGKESYSDNTLNSKTTQTHRRLTLDDEDSRPLLHEVDQLLWKASAVRVIFFFVRHEALIELQRASRPQEACLLPVWWCSSRRPILTANLLIDPRI